MGGAGYLLVGHGTRSEEGQQQLRTVFEQFSQLLAPTPAELAFLELAEPDIAFGLRRLIDRGVSEVVTVPVLLFSAGHALQDIPLAVSEAIACYEADKPKCQSAENPENTNRVASLDEPPENASDRVRILGQSASLETSGAILELSALRFRQAVCHPVGDCMHVCEGKHCGRIALGMLGRGSRSVTATEQMRRFAVLRRELTPVQLLATGFVYAQEPTVEETLELLAASQEEIVVVQPHLLFVGQLMDQIRGQVAEYAQRYSGKQWIVVEPLGTDIALAQTLAQLSREVLAAEPSQKDYVAAR